MVGCIDDKIADRSAKRKKIKLGQNFREEQEGERRNMIARIWHGWTTPGNANKYDSLLREEIFVGIQNRRIPGFKSIQLLRREIGKEVEFVTIMLFDSLDAIREFAGEDYPPVCARIAIRRPISRVRLADRV